MIRKILGMFIMFMGIAFIISHFAGKELSYHLFSSETRQLQIQKILDGRSINKIRIETDMANISVFESSDEKIYVELSGSVDEKLEQMIKFTAETDEDQANIALRLDSNQKPFRITLLLT